MIKNGTFFVAASALIINENKEVLITQRSYKREHHPGEWETQSGRLLQGESIIDGLKREMSEELNIEVEPIMPISTFHFFRGPEKIEHVGVTYLCKIKAGEIKVDGIEEINFKWVNLVEALRIIKDESVGRDIKILQGLINKGLVLSSN